MRLLDPTPRTQKSTVSVPRKRARGLLPHAGDPWSRDRVWGAGSWAPSRPVEVIETRRMPGGCGGTAWRREPSPELASLRRALTPPGPPSPPTLAASRAHSSPAPPGAEVGQAGGPRARPARSVPFPPPLSAGFRGRGGASRLEGALAPRSRARQVPRLPPPPRGERGRAGGRGGGGEPEEGGRLAAPHSAAGAAGEHPSSRLPGGA